MGGMVGPRAGWMFWRRKEFLVNSENQTRNYSGISILTLMTELLLLTSVSEKRKTYFFRHLPDVPAIFKISI
jgi:hypothetical protein